MGVNHDKQSEMAQFGNHGAHSSKLQQTMILQARMIDNLSHKQGAFADKRTVLAFGLHHLTTPDPAGPDRLPGWCQSDRARTHAQERESA